MRVEVIPVGKIKKIKYHKMSDAEFLALWKTIEGNCADDVRGLMNLTKNFYNPEDKSKGQKEIQLKMQKCGLNISIKIADFFGIEKNI